MKRRADGEPDRDSSKGMTMTTRKTVRAALCAAGLMLALHSACTWAGPDDDYREGLRAYHAADMVQAMAILKKSADAGHAPSQALLGDILDQAEFNEEAVAYFRRAALQGNADGEYGLGSMYGAGEGVKRDDAQALKWFTRAAEKRHTLATKVLAEAYMKGGLGLGDAQRNGPDAARWVRGAADIGHIPALEFLARAHRTGGLGLAVDVKQADALDAQVRTLRGIAEGPRTPKKGRKQ